MGSLILNLLAQEEVVENNLKKRQLRTKGQSLLELILAIAIFGLVAASVASLSLGGFVGIEQGGKHTKAAAYAQEGLEAVRSIKDRAWNELVYTTSSISINANVWVFDGEGTTDTIDGYSRTISFHDVCRDVNDNITPCPGSYTDISTKEVISEINWTTGIGINNSVSYSGYLSNWEGIDWTQTDWTGGGGQSIWSDPSRYESDDGNIETSLGGQISLLSVGDSYDWPFNIAGNYTYDMQDIEITDGVAKLVNIGGPIITDPFIDSLEFDTSNGETPSVVNISGDIYAVAYEGSGSDGFVSTLSISQTGVIGNSIIDTLEFDTSQGLDPSIIHVSGDVYAIAYAGSGNDGFLVTIDIDSSGNIANSVIDTFEYNTNQGMEPSIVNVSGNVYAIAYRGSGSDGWLQTITIDGAGTIGGTIDVLEFDASSGREAHLINIDGQLFAIAYRGPSNDGFINTFSIDGSGNISSVIDVLEFDTFDTYDPRIINISGTVYAVIYEGSGQDGFIKTFSIDGSGNISSLIDVYEYETDRGESPDIIQMSGTLYMIAYEGAGSDGYASLVDIQNDGTITKQLISTYEFDTSNGEDSFLVRLSNTHTAVFYDGTSTDGLVRTLEISNSILYPTNNPTIFPASSHVPASLTKWNSFTETATKDGGEIYYQLSDDNGATWQYWNGSMWEVAGVGNYNTANIIDTNIANFSISTGQIVFRAFFDSDGTQLVQLDNIRIGWNEIGSVMTNGYLISSAFDMTDASPVQIIEWDESIPACSPECTIRFSLRTAQDSGGLPGTWSVWYGEGGAGTYFTNNAGALVPFLANGNEWVQYRVELNGDGTNTPILEEVRINYK
jgi:type II secretory pathway pseudopilin PulG